MLEVNGMKNLRKLRRDAAMSQFALAKATTIHRWRISHAELGMLELTPIEVAAIRKVLVDVSRKKSARVLAELSA